MTGSSRGIGRACAIKLASLGADVAINYLSSHEDAAGAAREIQRLGRRCVVVRADVSKVDEVEAMVEVVADRLGSPNIIISNAAAGGFRQASQLTLPNVEAIFRANALPILWLTQSAAPGMTDDRKPNRVIAISSHGSTRAILNYAAIGASKAALESFVRHLAIEYGPRGINFNCVLSGMVATEAVQTMPDFQAILLASQERMLIPPEPMLPENVADAVAFLASQQSKFIQGQTLVVDGGISVRV